MSPDSSGFLTPREALEQEFQRAVEDLRREVGDPKSLRDRWRFWRARRRLYMEKVVHPTRTANW